MRHSAALRRIGTGLLAVGLGATALGAGKAAGAPGLADALAVAGSVIASPAAAFEAADQLFHEKALPAAQTQVEDEEGPADFVPPTEQELLPGPSPAASEAQPGSEAASEPAAEMPEGAGKVSAAHYGQGSGAMYISCGAGTIKNNTKLTSGEVAAAAAASLPFAVEANSAQPQVLIMHTHATESYELEDNGWFDPEYTARRTDNELNMVSVGAKIAEELNAAGINTVQDSTLHDYPSYNGSYERSNKTVRGYLEQYPSIKVVLDVHRDAIERDGERIKAVADIEGQTAAQVMIICGADKNGNLPNFKQNLAFASAWENAMESRYPGLTRPVLFDYRYYNQDLTTGSLLIEMGSHGNTLAEAQYSGQLVGRALAALLLGQ